VITTSHATAPSVELLSQTLPLHPTRCRGFPAVGTWLSLVEHSLGVRGVGSSNLPVPTITLIHKNLSL
jgi:hypothetical protein